MLISGNGGNGGGGAYGHMMASGMAACVLRLAIGLATQSCYSGLGVLANCTLHTASNHMVAAPEQWTPMHVLHIIGIHLRFCHFNTVTT